MEPGALDFQIANFLRFMQAKVSKNCIITLSAKFRSEQINFWNLMN